MSRMRNRISSRVFHVYIYVAGRGQQLSKTHETYLISAESAQDADDWVAAIRRVMHEVGVPCFHMSMLTRSLWFCAAIWWRNVWAQSGRDTGSGVKTWRRLYPHPPTPLSLVSPSTWYAPFCPPFTSLLSFLPLQVYEKWVYFVCLVKLAECKT